MRSASGKCAFHQSPNPNPTLNLTSTKCRACNASWLNAHIWSNALHIWSNAQFAKCKGTTTGGRGSGPPPPTFWRTPQLLTQRFCRGSTVKPAEWIRCIIQKKKERNSSCYYCKYYPLLCLVFGKSSPTCDPNENDSRPFRSSALSFPGAKRP